MAPSLSLLLVLILSAVVAQAFINTTPATPDVPSKWQIVKKSPKSITATFSKGETSFHFETLRTVGKVYDMDATLPQEITKVSENAKKQAGDVTIKAGEKPKKTVPMPTRLPESIPVKHREVVSLALFSSTGLVFATFEGDVPQEWSSKLSKMSTTPMSVSVATDMRSKFAEAASSLAGMDREVALARNFMNQLVAAAEKSGDSSNVAGEKGKNDKIADSPKFLIDTNKFSNPGPIAAAAALVEEGAKAKEGVFPIRYYVHLYTGKAFNVAGDHSATRVERRNDQDNSFLSAVEFCNHGRCPGDDGMAFKCTKRGGVNQSTANQPPNWMCQGAYFPVWCYAFLGIGGTGFHNCNGDATYQMAVAANPSNPPGNSIWGICGGMCPATSPNC